SLAVALGLDPEELRDRLERSLSKRFVWIKRRLSPDELRSVRDLHWPLSWVAFQTELDRCYPQGFFASHVVGIRDIDGVGRDGIERTFDAILRGQPGYRIVARDASGKTLAVQDHLRRLPQAGSSIVLTIDSAIQTYVEN